MEAVFHIPANSVVTSLCLCGLDAKSEINSTSLVSPWNSPYYIYIIKTIIIIIIIIIIIVITISITITAVIKINIYIIKTLFCPFST